MVFATIFASDWTKQNKIFNTTTASLCFAALLVILCLEESLTISSWHRFFSHCPKKRSKQKGRGWELSKVISETPNASRNSVTFAVAPLNILYFYYSQHDCLKHSHWCYSEHKNLSNSPFSFDLFFVGILMLTWLGWEHNSLSEKNSEARPKNLYHCKIWNTISIREIIIDFFYSYLIFLWQIMTKQL